MKYRALSMFWILFLVSFPLFAESPADETLVDDPSLLEVLEKINSVDAYEVPDLQLKRDQNYANTAVDVEPFSGVKPFKEHFLEQMEYTGPGRAIPEPEDIESVKLILLALKSKGVTPDKITRVHMKI